MGRASLTSLTSFSITESDVCRPSSCHGHGTCIPQITRNYYVTYSARGPFDAENDAGRDADAGVIPETRYHVVVNARGERVKRDVDGDSSTSSSNSRRRRDVATDAAADGFAALWGSWNGSSTGVGDRMNEERMEKSEGKEELMRRRRYNSGSMGGEDGGRGGREGGGRGGGGGRCRKEAEEEDKRKPTTY